MLEVSPQFLYIILILPSLFGLTLLGEGLNKVIHEEWGGVFSIIFGLMFMGIVLFTYSVAGSYLAVHRPMY